jgi:hypothetical protein
MSYFIYNPTYFVKALFPEGVHELQQAAKCIHRPKKGQELLVQGLKATRLVNNSQPSAEKDVTYSGAQ